ncbi:MAG: Cgl0159 family (beta/alpha)8-fold protein [Acidimicrobiales bacterium]|jgi:hypothetical protein
MRAYWLNTASWSRIVTHRVRRPEAIMDRLSSRRRLDERVPIDGQLVLITCNQQTDPRTALPVERRELLDRIIEALSIPEVDGVIASADLLEELTLLNVLENRLAFCTASGDPYIGAVSGLGSSGGGVAPSTIVASHFDGAFLSQRWGATSSLRASQPWCVAADIAELGAHELPTILDLCITGPEGRSESDTEWSDWIEPLHATTSALATGAGVWLTVPAITGLVHLAEATGFPVLMRDTDVPIHPSAWQSFFEADLPLTIRGMIPGVSALFPLEGSVAEATATIARSVRNLGAKPGAA